ncbi:MAG: hypothetical protein CVU64_16050 [Deltaproteobacteria bacterium HGW-Deltaproteobacteria-21]|nr:MAG: hypothetical protein CVU64_16050 [Deltaproteobacteria bacterium HGW-Deltaproteobacteria-21]
MTPIRRPLQKAIPDRLNRSRLQHCSSPCRARFQDKRSVEFKRIITIRRTPKNLIKGRMNMKRISPVVLIGIFLMTGICGDALAQQKVIKITYSDHNPPNAWCTVNGTEPWLKRIEKATDGKVKIERYYAESLAKGTDAWMGIKTGVVDMAWCAQGYWAGVTPLSDVITLPFLPFKNGRQAGGILWKLREKYPEIRRSMPMCTSWSSTPHLPYPLSRQRNRSRPWKISKVSN